MTGNLLIFLNTVFAFSSIDKLEGDKESTRNGQAPCCQMTVYSIGDSDADATSHSSVQVVIWYVYSVSFTKEGLSF